MVRGYPFGGLLNAPCHYVACGVDGAMVGCCVDVAEYSGGGALICVFVFNGHRAPLSYGRKKARERLGCTGGGIKLKRKLDMH